MKNLLEIHQFSIHAAEKSILHEVSFDVRAGRITALVGASGSGKTSIANGILGLLPQGLEITGGQILFENKNILKFDEADMRRLRGKDIAMVFQEPLSAFNPLMTIGQQIDEVLQAHTQMSQSQRTIKVIDALARVELPNPKEISNRYPHQLSGGQRQRAMIAQAIVTSPKLIMADEPTSNLDVTLQAKIMDLFRDFKKEGQTMLLISHDLGLVSHLADDMIVLQQGSVVEAGRVEDIMKNPRHRYTQALMEAFI